MDIIEKIKQFFERLFKRNNFRHHLLRNKRHYLLKERWPERDLDEEVDVQVGDLIWAKRYKTEEEKELIPINHREGPYIVLKKVGKDLICSYGTGVDPAKYNRKNYFTLDDIKYYNLYKVTYFNLQRLETINKFSFIRQIDELTRSDKEKLYQQIKISNRNYYHNSRRVNLNLPLRSADIISIDNVKYVVVDVNDTSMQCLPIYKDIKSLTIRDIANLDYSKIVSFEKNVKYYYMSVLDDELFKILLKFQKEYINSSVNAKVPQRGSVILINGKLYYIYGEEGQDWLMFEIFSSPNKKQDCIRIKKNNFYTEYSSYKLSKKQSFEVILLATDDEMDEIKIQKKDFAKKASKNTKKGRR